MLEREVSNAIGTSELAISSLEQRLDDLKKAISEKNTLKRSVLLRIVEMEKLLNITKNQFGVLKNYIAITNAIEKAGKH